MTTFQRSATPMANNNGHSVIHPPLLGGAVPHNHLMRQTLQYPRYRWGNWSIEIVANWLKVTRQVLEPGLKHRQSGSMVSASRIPFNLSDITLPKMNSHRKNEHMEQLPQVNLEIRRPSELKGQLRIASTKDPPRHLKETERLTQRQIPHTHVKVLAYPEGQWAGLRWALVGHESVEKAGPRVKGQLYPAIVYLMSTPRLMEAPVPSGSRSIRPSGWESLLLSIWCNVITRKWRGAICSNFIIGILVNRLLCISGWISFFVSDEL